MRQPDAQCVAEALFGDIGLCRGMSVGSGACRRAEEQLLFVSVTLGAGGRGWWGRSRSMKLPISCFSGLWSAACTMSVGSGWVHSCSGNSIPVYAPIRSGGHEAEPVGRGGAIGRMLVSAVMDSAQGMSNAVVVLWVCRAMSFLQCKSGLTGGMSGLLFRRSGLATRS